MAALGWEFRSHEAATAWTCPAPRAHKGKVWQTPVKLLPSIQHPSICRQYHFNVLATKILFAHIFLALSMLWSHLPDCLAVFMSSLLSSSYHCSPIVFFFLLNLNPNHATYNIQCTTHSCGPRNTIRSRLSYHLFFKNSSVVTDFQSEVSWDTSSWRMLSLKIHERRPPGRWGKVSIFCYCF